MSSKPAAQLLYKHMLHNAMPSMMSWSALDGRECLTRPEVDHRD
ncbi:MAG: hypothetical protein ACJ74Z_03335 [Bryobacteraceae bacterium]